MYNYNCDNSIKNKQPWKHLKSEGRGALPKKAIYVFALGPHPPICSTLISVCFHKVITVYVFKVTNDCLTLLGV